MCLVSFVWFQAPCTFHSVVFFDASCPNFTLTGVFRYGVSTNAWEQMSGREAGPKYGVGMQLNFKMTASDKVRVKVSGEWVWLSGMLT